MNQEKSVLADYHEGGLLDDEYDPQEQMRQLIVKSDLENIKDSLTSSELKQFGASYLQLSCALGKPQIVKFLLQKGVDVSSPPELVTFDESYRRSPFIIQAARSNSIETFEEVKNASVEVTERGSICLSRVQGNVVVSNAIGCAAYYGQVKMLKYLLGQLPQQAMELEAQEHKDKQYQGQGYGAQFVAEYNSFTPLMLAVVGRSNSLECVKALLDHDADHQCEDDYGNTLLHIAAMNKGNEIMNYLIQRFPIDVNEKNAAGQSALSICQA